MIVMDFFIVNVAFPSMQTSLHSSASDIESLGEEVRRRVRKESGIELTWEIMRIGAFA